MENAIELERIGRAGAGVGHVGQSLKRRMSWSPEDFTQEKDPPIDSSVSRHALVVCGTRRHHGKDEGIGQNDTSTHYELLYGDGKHAQASAQLAQCIALDRPKMAYGVKTPRVVL